MLAEWIVGLVIGIACSSTTAARFAQPMGDVMVSTGREAQFTCVVVGQDAYKVAFLRVDTQTILTIDETIITRNSRVSVRFSVESSAVDSADLTGSLDQKSWHLIIKDVQVSDRGAYMCQLNSEPMVSQIAYLNVHVAPHIIDSRSSSDITVFEGTNVTLTCEAVGYPVPTIKWKRMDNQPIHGQNVSSDGASLYLTHVQRHQMASYLCIASNGVPPTPSKLIRLNIIYPPTVEMTESSVQTWVGQPLTLHCRCHSNPPALTGWTHHQQGNLSANIDVNVTSSGSTIWTWISLGRAERMLQGHYICWCANDLGSANRSISVLVLDANTSHQRRTVSFSEVKSELQETMDAAASVGLQTEATTNWPSMRPTVQPTMISVVAPFSRNGDATGRQQRNEGSSVITSFLIFFGLFLPFGFFS